jgi:hypothetical protein
MPQKKLTVPFVEQFQRNFCGPACAQMILLASRKVADGSRAVQSALFADIQNDTRPGFPRVERCGRRVLSWESFPEALLATLNRRMALQPSTFAVHHDRHADVSTARAVRSINSDVPCAALLEDSTHWMVVFGWEARASRRRPLRSVSVDGHDITHVFVHDPNWAFPTLMDIEQWTAVQYQVDCGTFNQEFVVIGKP